MNLQKRLKILGIISILIGCTAALLCISSTRGLFFAIPVGFIGMLCSGIYVFIDTRNEVNTKKITPGIIAMVLSSVPVLFMLVFMIIDYYNKKH
jgi:hypothetical protein